MLAPDVPGNVSFWLTYGTKVDHWFYTDFTTSLLPASDGDGEAGVVYGIDYQYSEHDAKVLMTVRQLFASACLGMDQSASVGSALRTFSHRTYARTYVCL